MPNWLRNGVLTGSQRSLGLSTSVEFRSPVAVGVPGVPLLTPPASVTDPLAAPLITAASLVPLMVMVTSCWVPSTVVAVNVSVSVSPDIERLHGRIAVVQRVGPDPGGGERVAAVAVGARCRADRRPGVVRIVDVGGIEVAGRGCPACRWRPRRPRPPSR